jgi:hypothetical protein
VSRTTGSLGRRGLAAGAVCLALSGCGAPSDSEGGFGLPRQPDDAPVPGARESLDGVLRVEADGCFTWESGSGERRWVLWPPGSEDAGAQVRLPDGALVGDGQALSGTGALVGATALPQWESADSYFRSFGTFCDAGDTGVVVLDAVRAGP